MAISPQHLERLQKIFERLSDPDPGSRAGAANGIFQFCAREKIDLRDLYIDLGADTLGGMWHDLYRRVQEGYDFYRNSMESQAHRDHEQITALRAENERLKQTRQNRRTKAVIDLEAQLDQARARIAELEAAHDTSDAYQASLARIRELEAENANLTSEANDKSDTVRAYQAKITELESEIATWRQSAGDTSQTLEASHARIATLEGQMADLKNEIRDTHDLYLARIDSLEAALNPPDPWRPAIEAYLGARPDEHRHTSVSLLEAAGVAIDIQNAEAFRRLGRIMRIIGDDWIVSSNIPDGTGRRVRGYLRRRY